jgi:hypothetical protein
MLFKDPWAAYNSSYHPYVCMSFTCDVTFHAFWYNIYVMILILIICVSFVIFFAICLYLLVRRRRASARQAALSYLVLQNIAARNPCLSGHLRPQVLRAVGFGWSDWSWSSILSFLTSFTRPKLAKPTERWASVVQGPLVSERPTFRPWCMVEGRWERRGGILVVPLMGRDKIDISCLISSFAHRSVRAWRPATRRRVRSLQRPSPWAPSLLPASLAAHPQTLSAMFLSSLSPSVPWCGGCCSFF